MPTTLIIPAYIAGFLTFLAPCTLPLVPGYLVFISGTSLKDLQDPKKAPMIRWRIFLNGLMYVIGFTTIFVGFGLLFSAGGIALGAQRIWLERIGGILVIFFGLYLMNVFDHKWFRWMDMERRLPTVRGLTPGKPLSSFIFGASFALAWTPCVGPILGTILLLASTSTTALSGGLLLLVFSAGLATPFLLTALGIGQASRVLQRFTRTLGVVTVASGAFIVFLGVLLVTGNLAVWNNIAFSLFRGVNYDRLLNYM